MPKPKKPSKYHAEPCEVDGIRFASRKEARRYEELKLREKAGEIRGLSLQPVFDVRAAVQSHAGAPIQMATVAKYLADFSYEVFADGRWRRIVEDVKGMKTPMYRLKKKIVEASYGITIVEI